MIGVAIYILYIFPHAFPLAVGEWRASVQTMHGEPELQDSLKRIRVTAQYIRAESLTFQIW